jgi:DNA invertase Pin-like site-specific DNA recombinase
MEINNKYGYVRVSSKSQESNSSIASQKQQLIQTGIEEQNIFVEVGSVANEIKNQPIFQRLVSQKLKENDLLMVIKIDELKYTQVKIKIIEMQDRVIVFSDYFHSQINEIIATITDIRSPFYTWFFLWIFIKISRKVNKI